MAASVFAKPPPPDCPRCGYDLSGLVKTWTTDCPLDGCCSECGLEFPSREVLNPAHRLPAWSYEHDARGRVTSLLRTISRVSLPKGPWNTLRLTTPIVRPRLVSLLVLSLVSSHLLLGLIILATDLIRYPNSPVIVSRWLTQDVFPTLVWPYLSPEPFRDPMGVAFTLGWTWTIWAFMPLSMLILRETFQRFKLRQVHLLRGAAYSAPAAFAVAWLGVLIVVLVGGTPCLSPLVSVFWLALWWFFFIESYLRLPHPLVIMLVLMFLSTFAAFVLWSWIAVSM